jgi:hypothetical protein
MYFKCRDSNSFLGGCIVVNCDMIVFIGVNQYYNFIWSYYNKCFVTHIKHTKKKIPDKINVRKTIFYIFDVLNAQILR